MPTVVAAVASVRAVAMLWNPEGVGEEAVAAVAWRGPPRVVVAMPLVAVGEGRGPAMPRTKWN